MLFSCGNLTVKFYSNGVKVHNLKNLILLFIFSICYSSGSKWNYHDGHYHRPNELIIMLSSEISPLLGKDKPLDIQNRQDLNSLLNKNSKLEKIEPLFRFYKNFTELEWKHSLHQFYLLTFSEIGDIRTLITNLENHNDIETVNLNFRAEAYTTPNDPYYNSQWGHNNIGQAVTPNGNSVGIDDSDTDTDLAWDITQGSENITIAIIDTGVNGNHEEFQGKMVPGYDFVDNDTDASDGNMHGTACAGIAAAQGNNGVGIAGVAWNCKIMPIKSLSDDGFGDYADIVNGVQFSAQEGANVISMSLGGGGFDNSMNYAINYANDLNSVVISASGNDNSSSVSYPAAYEGSIAVGSLSPCNERKNTGSCDGENYWGSNYGSELDFLAPGVRIHTTALNGGYMSDFNGTSSATPHAAGIAALILSVEPSLSPDNVKEIMQVTCDDIGPNGWDSETGYGRLNAYMSLIYLTGGPEIGLGLESLNVELESGSQTTIEVPIINGGEIDLNISVDPFGYSYTTSDDDATYSWLDIQQDGLLYSFPNNDASGINLDLDFSFPFYNNSYNSLFINANGWIGFGNDNTEWNNSILPSNSAPSPAIFPFWDDLNPVNDNCNDYCSGNVYYKSENDKFIIWFDNVAHWWTNYENSFYDFQVVLHNDGNIDFNYRSITGSYSPTIGIQDSNGNYIMMAYAQDPTSNLFVSNEFSVPIDLRGNWISVDPLVLTVPPGGIQNLNVSLDATNLSDGDYNDYFVINSNDFDNSILEVPVSLIVNGDSCSGWELGDINNDSIINVLDIVRVINFILDVENPDECQALSSDINQDELLNIQDIVLIINLIVG